MVVCKIDKKLLEKVEGHCLCGVGIKCPCNSFIKENKCKCKVFMECVES